MSQEVPAGHTQQGYHPQHVYPGQYGTAPYGAAHPNMYAGHMQYPAGTLTSPVGTDPYSSVATSPTSQGRMMPGVPGSTVLPQSQQEQQNGGNSGTGGGGGSPACVFLCNRSLWVKFYQHTTEMIITKQGRSVTQIVEVFHI